MQTDIEYPQCSVCEMFLASCQKYPQDTAIEYFGAKISYSKLKEYVDACAKSLLSLGCREGEHIAVILPNIPQAAILFYAASRIGAVADMIHPLSAVREFEFYIKNSNIRFVFAVDLLAEKISFLSELTEVIILVSPAQFLPAPLKIASSFKAPKHAFSTFEKFLKRGEKSDINLENRPFTDSKKPCALLYTGGTTGDSKGVLLSSDNFNCCALEAIKSCGCLERGDRVLTVLPVFHGFGLGVCIHTVMVFGGICDMVPKFKVREFEKLILKHRPQVVAAVPALYHAMVTNDIAGADLSFLKCVISGGDMLPVKLQRDMNALLSKHNSKLKIRQGYGLAECLSGVCLMPEGCEAENCLGLPYPDNEFKIDGAKNLGDDGEILISSPVVMLGYHNNPEQTDMAITIDEAGKRWLHTGDMGHMDEEGLVYFKCRIKNIIVSNGYDIYPGPVEDVIRQVKNVADCAVVGIPDEDRGEIAKAFIVLKNKDNSEQTLDEVKGLLENSISHFSIPRQYQIIDSLPRTKIGKVDTQILKTFK